MCESHIILPETVALWLIRYDCFSLGYKLEGNEIESHSVSSPMNCIIMCVNLWPKCKSVNYKPTATSDVKNCLLNHKLKDQDTASYVADSLFNYYENYYIAVRFILSTLTTFA